MKKHISAVIEPPLYERLAQIALTEKVTKTDVISKAIEEYLARYGAPGLAVLGIEVSAARYPKLASWARKCPESLVMILKMVMRERNLKDARRAMDLCEREL